MKQSLKAKEISIAGIFIALTAIFSQISIPLPFTPIPISCGLIAVYIAGILLKPRLALLSQIGYLLLGMFGLPVYSGFKGGLGILFGPTGGFLFAYPIMAFLVSVALNSKQSLQMEENQGKGWLFAKSTVSITLAQCILYASGALWFSFTTGNSLAATLAMTVYPFVFLDLLKMAFCVIAIIPFRTRMKSANMLILDRTI